MWYGVVYGGALGTMVGSIVHNSFVCMWLPCKIMAPFNRKCSIYLSRWAVHPWSHNMLMERRLLEVKLVNIWAACTSLGILGRMILCLYVCGNCICNISSSFTVMWLVVIHRFVCVML